MTRATMIAAVNAALLMLSGCGESEESSSEAESASPPAGEAAAAEAPPIVPMLCAGGQHTCALRPDGHVLCWGTNLDGQLGDGTRQERWAPSPVMGISDATSVSCGHRHTCAVRRGGRVSCWGSNGHGELGLGDTAVRLEPAEVPGLTGVAELALGYDLSCARKTDGSVMCWGVADEGSLGPGVTADAVSPRPIAGIAGATAITNGSSTVCAIGAGGVLSCWGSNGFGQRGHGGSGIGVVPGVVATAVASGNGHTCAATATGAMCWGYDNYGQLGNGQAEGEADRAAAPVAVQGLPGAVTQITAGNGYTCGLVADGRLFCWGYGGRLGIDDSDNRTSATEVPGVAGLRQIEGGSEHMCALRSDGAVSCWGTGASGELGNGSRYSRTPVVVAPDITQMAAEPPARESFPPGTGEPATPQLVVGRDYVCGLVSDGRVRCFGGGSAGQLGSGSTASADSDQEGYVVGITDARQISGWWEATCAVRAGGQVACWGKLPVSWDEHALAPTSLPRSLPGVSDAVEVAVGQTSLCVRHRGGTVSCLGDNSSGQLGNGSFTRSNTLVPVSGLSDAVQLSTGYATTCARRATGALVCWGANDNGLLGTGSAERSSNVPVEVAGLTRVTDIDVDYYDACAVHGGRVSCWGKNDYGQIGNGRVGADAGSTRPSRVASIDDAVAARAYQSVVCVVRQGGDALCWGANNAGQVGANDAEPYQATFNVPAPVARAQDPTVGGFGPYVAYAPGMNFACGLHRSGNVSCAGSTPIRRGGGFLGIGATRSRFPVAAPGFVLGATPQ